MSASASSSSTETLIDWDEETVNQWLAGLGFSQYQNQIIGPFDATLSTSYSPLLCLAFHPHTPSIHFTDIIHIIIALEHGISGEILSLLDHEGLKEVGVHSVGQRLTILREVYYLKVAHGVTIEPEHYVPPCELGTILPFRVRLFNRLSISSRSGRERSAGRSIIGQTA